MKTIASGIGYSLVAATLLLVGCAAEADDGAVEDDDTTIAESTSDALSPTDGRATIRFQNNCGVTVRLYSRAAGQLATLRHGGAFERDVGPDNVAHPTLVYWAVREGTNLTAGNVTLAEFSLNMMGATDFYDVSLVDGFNMPMRIGSANGQCPLAQCTAKLNYECPAGNQIRQGGNVVACSKFGDRDNPNNAAARLFDRRCPDAYSWSADVATKGCAAQDYVVTLCP